MKAVAFKQPLPIEHPESLVDITLPEPVPTGRDILVEVQAVSVNPVDTKVRRGLIPSDTEWRVTGWDATGIVKAVGEGGPVFNRVIAYGTPAPLFVRAAMHNCSW